MDEGYDTAQVCLNGHVANASSRETPEFNKDHCEKCGVATISTCPSCGTDIRGYYWGNMSTAEYHPPAFCHSCGDPFPWTQATLEAARELARELDALDENDRTTLEHSLDDLVRDTPATAVAALRFKKIVEKAGREAVAGFRHLLVDVVSETVKKLIWS